MSARLSRSLHTARTKSKKSRKSKRSRDRKPRFEALEDRRLLAVAPALIEQFEAFDYDDNVVNAGGLGLTPPDPYGAAGPEHVVNVGNVTIQWFEKDGTEQQHTSLRNFFNLDPRVQPQTTLFDPKVVYDQYNERFVVMALELQDNFPNDPTNMSRILIAVSDDSDPNGSWYYTDINGEVLVPDPTDPAITLATWSDYPGLAIDEEAIYVTVNLFEFTNFTSVGNRLWIVDKGEDAGGLYDGGYAEANMYDPAGDVGVDFDINPNFPGLLFRSMSPAHTFGDVPDGVGTWLAMYDGYSNGIEELVDIIRVDNPLGTPTFSLQTVNVGDIDDTDTPMIGAAQKGSIALIDGGDRRTLNAVWRNDQLYVSTVVLPDSGPDVNQITAHWFQFDTTAMNTVSLADQGNVGGEELGFKVNTIWPSVMVDAEDNMAVAFSATGPTMYAGSYYTVRAADDPAATVRDAQVLRAGVDVYNSYRWGDYSSVAIDPTDEVTFWTYNMYSMPQQGLPGKWGTYWGSFRLADVPDPPPPGPTTITGFKWHDLDSDGRKDANEPGIGNWLVYADLDGDGQLDLTEPTARTNAAGVYTMTVGVSGELKIRENLPPGWVQTFPGEPNYAHVLDIPLTGGGTITGINFGNSDAGGFDHGDAPAPYPTLQANSGARHPISDTLKLGLLVDGEPDGIPTTLADGDDLLNADDEDGIVFPTSMTPGNVESVVVSNIGSGFLQGWVDFNGNGSWSDPGEQVFTNISLTTGTRSLSFSVPDTASPGQTYARFRFSQQGGLSPSGASNRFGEVEDYIVSIASDTPIAVDDNYTVQQNSSNNIFRVMDNDIPSASGQANLRLETVLDRTNTSGSAIVDRNGTPNIYTDDFIRYTPAPGAFAPDEFGYTITDVTTGNSDSAVVKITIVPFVGLVPVAVDDIFDFTGGASQDLDVLANDVPGPTLNIRIPANGIDTTGTIGTAQLVTVGGEQFVRYSPNGFNGTDQFEYTIVDDNGAESTATVTIQNPGHGADDIVQYKLEAIDLQGNPITQIGQGQQFRIRVITNDLRGESGRPPINNPDYPVGSSADQGVFSAYVDLLYDASMIAYQGDSNVRYSNEFGSAKFLDSSVPGILNDSGAVQSRSTPPGPTDQFVFDVLFTATARGTAAFRSDPADDLPLHETATWFPEKEVNYPRIEFNGIELDVVDPSVISGGGGEGEFTNPANPLDVNNSGDVSPLDALSVINRLNKDGVIDLTVLAGGEGEAGQRFYYDTNRDMLISPSDVLPIINFLNKAAQQGGSSEGEALPGLGDPIIVAAEVDIDTVQRIVAAIPLDNGANVQVAPSADSAGAVPAALVQVLKDEPANQYAAPADEQFSVENYVDLSSDIDDDLAEDIADAWMNEEFASELG